MLPVNEGKSHIPVVLVAVVNVLIIGQAAPSQVLGLALHLHKGYWSEDCTLYTVDWSEDCTVYIVDRPEDCTLHTVDSSDDCTLYTVDSSDDCTL